MRRLTLPSWQEWRSELADVVRGLAGGFLFGIPLIYTMEVWWIGSYADAGGLLGVLASTYVIVFLLNRTDGFRQQYPDQIRKALTDSVEALAIGIVCVTWVLILLQEITWDTSVNEAVGKIVFESVPFAIGVGLARSILQGNRGGNDEENDSGQPPRSQGSNSTLTDIGATLIGSIFIGFSIAPTDEVPMLAAAISPPWLLVVIGMSLLVSYCIVFAAGFTTQKRRLQEGGLFQRPFTETIVSYLLSLSTAAIMLYFFHRLDFSDPWNSWLEQTLLLGLPATIGGAAGRIAI
ncbi:TIGR02587 family membrane protein [Leptolyngbya sp. FACHB-711]|uniref:TIGR02587 family membrane protein n=1 Tax=unclassified Leptolyngbya TaxID=2650499 RepID=UPI001689097B|nr:TIGR02587 family membrane protein [Cyanobacteria bacterium FACHB-502]MBD2023360.1 TIGR02587 family membrane protein [Leptolyngbya sp. FACHB-711]